MGKYLNPGNESFEDLVRSDIYVDKTGLIAYMNDRIGKEKHLIAFSRPRRFGKTMAVKMLTAYYSRGCDSKKIFKGLKIGENPSFEEHLNKYDVIRLDIQWMRSIALSNIQEGKVSGIIQYIQNEVLGELRLEFPQYISKEEVSVPAALANINAATKRQFIIIIDEWDCLFREDKHNIELQKEYIDFLSGLFKGASADEFIKLAYITGILPIKKYGTQSALNNFREYTMVNPGVLAEFVGFTEDEVRALCTQYEMDFEEMRHWYDGYHFKRLDHVYSPNSVIEAIDSRDFDSYWTSTETYESLKEYIEMNFDGLKDDIIAMLGNGVCKVNPRRFQNDITSFNTKDDVLTLLIHLGYLTYDVEKQSVCIPNQELADEFKNAVETI